MNKTKQQPKTPFFKKHRILAITLILFLIVLPLLVIPTVYVASALGNKAILFEDKTLKAAKSTNVFTFDFELIEIIESNDENEGGYYIFDYKITTNDSVNTITNVRFKAQLSIRNDSYDSPSEREYTTLESSTTTKLRIPFNYDLDKTILPLVKADGPYLYLHISYIEIIQGLEQQNNKILIIKVPYDDSHTKVTPQ